MIKKMLGKVSQAVKGGIGTKILDMIIADRSSSQNFMQWPAGALEAAMEALRVEQTGRLSAERT